MGPVQKHNKARFKMGDALDFEELNRQRMEKDTKELKKLIEEHFVARKKDDDEFSKFEEHVNQRKTQRAEQIKLRQEREKEKRAREKEENKKLAFIPDRSAIKKKKDGEEKVSWNQKI